MFVFGGFLANFWNIFDQAFIGFLVMLWHENMVRIGISTEEAALLFSFFDVDPCAKVEVGEGSIWDDTTSLSTSTRETHE